MLLIHGDHQTTGVVHMPCGAHPSSCAPLYGFDVSDYEQCKAAVEQITVNVSNSTHLTQEVLDEATVANADAGKSGAIVANANDILRYQRR